MLFNKDNNGTDELRNHLGFLFKSMEFENIKTEVMLAEEDLTALIGNEVYDIAQNHYNSDNYGSESTDENDFETLNNLIHYIQLPVAYFAYHSYAPHTDVTHEDSGRKINIDPENQKIPFEWLLDRDNQGILNKAHKTTDRLISFLEENEEITGFADTDSQKEIRSLILQNTKALDNVFPIDNSRRFFLICIPFQKDAMKNHLRPVLGKDLYDTIISALQDAGNYEADEELFDLIKVAVGLKTMEIAAGRLSVKMLPAGIVQNYTSERITTKASKTPERDFISAFKSSLAVDTTTAFRKISDHLEIKAADADIDIKTTTPDHKMDVKQKFIRL